MKKFLLILVVACAALALTPQTSAASGFNAGRIIDDSVFTNKSTMSVDAIQSFLNSKVTTCDTNGSQQSEMNNSGVPDYSGNGSIQRWEWGKYKYNQTSFPCLRDYKQDGVSAAQLIYNAAHTYSINPQVLLVLLQKEQGLITDTWPLNVQYRSATGYGCPDTAACDSKYYGLKNQIDWASKMFRSILDNSPNWYTPYVLGNNYIQYNPNSSCGGSTVNIQNRSTQALYNYTPYQPNQAALDAGWGTANCGAYGNRNFYLYFTGWFGSTHGGESSIKDSVFVSKSLEITPNGSNNENQVYTASFTLRNKSYTRINVGWVLASVRDSANFNLDFPAKYITIEPNSTYTYTASRTFQWTDNMNAYINSNLAQGIGWSTAYPNPNDSSITKSTTFRVGSDVVLANNGIKVERINQTSTYRATATFYNRTNQDKNIGWYLISGRNPFGENVDFPTQNITVPAKGYATYSQIQALTDLGSYNFFSNLNDTSQDGYGWTTEYPMRNDIWSKKASTFTIGPSIIHSSPLAVEVTPDGEATATTSFKNQGTQSEYLGWIIVSTRRQGDTSNYDFRPQELTLRPGETRTITFKQSLLRTGTYTSKLLFNRPSGWTETYAPSARTSITRQYSFSGNTSVEQPSNTAITSTALKRIASFTLKNRSTKTQDLGWIIVSVRDPQGRNYDFPGVNAKLAPNETRTFTTSRSIPSGSYSISATANHPQYGWGVTFDTSGASYPMQVNLP